MIRIRPDVNLVTLAGGIASVVLLWAPTGLPAAQGGYWAQRWSQQGSQSYQDFGYLLEVIDDVDGDGEADFAVGWSAPVAQPRGFEFYSGADGSLLFTLPPAGASGSAISVCSVPDRDGDGLADVLVGIQAPSPWQPAGEIRLYSSQNSQLLQVYSGTMFGVASLGTDIRPAGDLDLDGWEDFLVHAGPSLLAISSRVGVELWRKTSGPIPFSLNNAPFLSLEEDLDGDGVPEVAIGDPVWQNGIVRLYSGADGRMLWASRPGTVVGFGWSLDLLPDLDGDGCSDLLVGEPGVTFAAPSFVHVLSGRTGRTLRTFGSWDPDVQLGLVLAALPGSADSDPVPDFAVGLPRYPGGPGGSAGRVEVRSMRDGEVIGTMDGQEPHGMLGWNLRAFPPSTRRVGPTILVGAPFESGAGGQVSAGGAHIYEFRPGLHLRPDTLSLGGTAPVEALLEFPPSEAGWSYALLASASGTGPTVLNGFEVPLTMDPLLARMSGGWFPTFLQNARGVLDAQGDARALIHPDPLLAPHLGRSFWLSAVVFIPGMMQVRMASVARMVTIGP